MMGNKRYKRKRRKLRRQMRKREHQIMRWCPVSKALGYDVVKRIFWWHEEAMDAWKKTKYSEWLRPHVNPYEHPEFSARAYGISSLQLGMFTVDLERYPDPAADTYPVDLADRPYFVHWFRLYQWLFKHKTLAYIHHDVINNGARDLQRLLKCVKVLSERASEEGPIHAFLRRCEEDFPYLISILQLLEGDNEAW